MSKVHARFRLYKDARAQYWHDGDYKPASEVELAAVQGPPFGPATPQGQIKMLIANPEALQVFRDAPLGQEYDVVFTPVKKAEDG
jgi:hypothetical protein